MKFVNLYKKELREMITPTTILILVLMYVGMTMMGSFMGDAVDKTIKDSSKIVICDQDNTEFTKSVIELMKKPAGGDSENEVKLVDIQSEDYASELDRLDISDVVIIPKGFTDEVEQGKTAGFIYVDKLTSLSTMANMSTGSSMAKNLIEISVTSALYGKKVAAGQLTTDEIKQLEVPVEITEKTVVSKNTEDIASQMVISLKTMENMFLPIIVFLLIVYSSQMVLGAVSTEKIDKTLETLLSAPVSRMAVLSSKMLAAGTVAALYAVVMMFSMGNLRNAVPTGDSNYEEQLKALGLTLSGADYIFIGMQMFVSILIALAVALVLGVLAKDAKSGQSLLLPIQMMSMVPYMLSMFVDIRTLDPLPIRFLIYAIPFTHTFMSSENLMFGHWGLYWAGLAYQLVLLVLCMGFAIHVFTSDKIFTLSLGNGKKKKGGLFGKKNVIDESDQ